MTDLNKKEKIIGIICYLAYSAVLTFQRHDPIALVYFAFVAVVVFFADNLIKEGSVKNKTLTAFFVTAVGYQTTFEIFYSVHNDFKQILSAVAVAVFYAGIFLLTDNRKIPWCIGAVPVLCILNVKIAIGFCVLLLCVSVMSPDKKAGKISFIGLAVSTVGLIACVVLALTTEGYFLENGGYLLSRFKNPLFLIVISVYLAVRLLKVKAVKIPKICFCIALFVLATVFSTLTLGWAVFASMSFCLPLLLGLTCLNDSRVSSVIRADFEKNKFIFVAVIICVLQ